MSSEVLVLIIFVVIAFVWLGWLSFLYYSALRHYRKLVGQHRDWDLPRVLEEVLGQVRGHSREIAVLKEFSEGLRVEGELHLQRTALVRFNPFDETGGDQSFALALLDKNGDGLVLSSLHTRDLTRVYGKPVRGGKPAEYDFSKEEKQAVELALEKK